MSADRRRVRSLFGLVLSRLGPNAHNVVSGTLLTLLVASRTTSAFLITFGTTAHNLFGWLTIPLVGRISDGRARRIGRRVPVMAAALAVMALGTFLYSYTDGYWLLVALVVLVRTAAINHGVTGVVAVPEVFGRHVWARAGLVIGGLGLAVSLFLRATVVGTWDPADPDTWSSTFRVAAVIIGIAAVALVALVREAPAAIDHDTRAVRSIHLEDAPNRRLLLTGLLLAIAAGGATGYIFPVFARDHLAASPGALAFYSLWSGALAAGGGVLGAVWGNARFTRRQIAVGAPLVLAAVGLAHVWATSLIHAALLGVAAAAAGAALLVSLLPLLLQLMPRSGGFAERAGRAYGPIVGVAVLAAYASGLAADAIGDLRAVWLFPAGLGVIQAIVSTRLRVPEGQEHTDLSAMTRRAIAAWRRSSSGRSRSLVRGDISRRDVDTLELVDALRAATDPYDGHRVADAATRTRGRQTMRHCARPVLRSLRRRDDAAVSWRRAVDRLGGGYAAVGARAAREPGVYGTGLASAMQGVTAPVRLDEPDLDDVRRVARWAAAWAPESPVAEDLATLVDELSIEPSEP